MLFQISCIYYHPLVFNFVPSRKIVHTVPCIHYFTILFATVPHPWTIHSSLYPPLRHTHFWSGVAVMSCRSPVGNAPHILLRLVSSYSPAWDTPRDTLVFRGVTLSSGAFFNAGLDVCCTSERCRPTLARYP